MNNKKVLKLPNIAPNIILYILIYLFKISFTQVSNKKSKNKFIILMYGYQIIFLIRKIPAK